MENKKSVLDVSIINNTSARPSLDSYRTSFSIIRQGNATNDLTKVKPRLGKNTQIDDITGVAKITEGGITVTIDEFNKQLSGLKTSTYKLLDALTVVMTKTASNAVKLALADYMNLCGLKDKKEARNQVNGDLEVLFNMKLSFKGKESRDYLDLRICDAKGIKNGIIGVSFTGKFYELLMSYPVMPYPNLLFRLNSQYNPNSYFFLRKISEHKNMNYGKHNADIISVKTLLKESPNIPTYEEVLEGGRQVEQRIIKPFERDMNALSEALSWSYCYRHNEPVSDDEVRALSFKDFYELMVHIKWVVYPDRKTLTKTNCWYRDETEKFKVTTLSV